MTQLPTFYDLSDFKRGWFIGNFEPSIVRSQDFEICITSHTQGEESIPHYHTHSTEINVVVDGFLNVNGKLLRAGEIFVYEAYEVSDVKFLADSILCVVRIPSQPNDKVYVHI
jgi:hypothetical protein